MKNKLLIILSILSKIIFFPIKMLMLVLPIISPILLGSLVLILFINVGDDIKTKAEQILAKLGISLNQEVSIEEQLMQNGKYDLSPMPIEKTTCDEGCNCQLKDYCVEETTSGDGSSNYTILKETQLLNKSDGLPMDWVYTGWTYLDKDHWDVDFSKFSNREPENIEKEYLFKWGVNRMNSKGRNIFTYESSSSINPETFRETFDEESRDGSYILSKGEFDYVDTKKNKKWKQKRQYLDLGKLIVCTQDYRIESAFSPMITAGEGGFENLLRARRWFHKGDVWSGREESFTNGRLNLWQNDIGRGAYIDVVFEDENNRQFVIPFIYQDAKNVHWFRGTGQQVDQRYGQVHVNRQQMNNNGTYRTLNKAYSATWKVIGTSQDDELKLRQQNYQFADISIIKFNSIQNLNYKLTADQIKEDELVDNLAGDNTLFDYYVFWGQTKSGSPAILKLDNFNVSHEEEVVGYYLSDDDTLILKSMSAIEIMQFYYDRQVSNTGQDFNHFLMNYLLRGEEWDGTPLNHWPECKIIGMRVYPDAHLDERSFGERRKDFQTVDDIPANNRVVEYCGPECKCNICTGVAR